MVHLNYQTKILRITGLENFSEQLQEAADLIKNNEILSFPTETVYGLGANALSETAVKKIFQAKGRPSDNPIIIHVSSIEMFERLIDLSYFDERIKKLQHSFWPGPLTLIIKKSNIVPYVTTGGLETVAIRMPSNKIALMLIKLSNLPIAAPSANLSGKPSPTTAQDVYEDMKGRIPLIIDGGDTEIGLESTVLDVSDPTSTPIILRPGKITKQQIESCLGYEIMVFDSSKLQKEVNQTQVKSPGMKYRHYAPNAELTVVPDLEAFLLKYREITVKYFKIGAIIHKKYSEVLLENNIHLVDSYTFFYTDQEELGSKLFQKLREMDKLGVDFILVQFNDIDGFGLAIQNRLSKASSKK